jgi:beta-glucosidase
VYVGAGSEIASVQQAIRSLRGFARVEMAAGERKHVTIHLDERSFQYWDEVSQSWKFNPGTRTIWVGDADALGSLPLSAPIRFRHQHHRFG